MQGIEETQGHIDKCTKCEEANRGCLLVSRATSKAFELASSNHSKTPPKVHTPNQTTYQSHNLKQNPRITNFYCDYTKNNSQLEP